MVMGFTHWNSSVPGVIQHSFVDTFGVFYDVDANWEHIGSAMGADSAYVFLMDILSQIHPLIQQLYG